MHTCTYPPTHTHTCGALVPQPTFPHTQLNCNDIDIEGSHLKETRREASTRNAGSIPRPLVAAYATSLPVSA
eukprot:2701536-Rhodomonas_salina.1